MKRLRKPRLESVSGNPVDISSLIDVCFLLLIYFLVTSVILPRESDISMAAGGRITHDVVEVDPLRVTIDASGQIIVIDGISQESLDKDPASRDLPLLVERLKFYKSGLEAAGHKPLVIIHAEDDCPYQRIIDVLNALAGVGIQSATFADPE